MVKVVHPVQIGKIMRNISNSSKLGFLFCMALVASSSIALLAQTDSTNDSNQSSGTNNGAQSSSAAASGDVTTPPAGSTDDAATTLQGGVQKIEVSLDDLRDVGLDLKHVLTACSHLYDEVTIQPVSIQTQPEVVGRGIVINIPIGFTPIGPAAPPRKDRVDMCMNEINPVISRMKKSVDEFLDGSKELDLSDDMKAQLQPLTQKWVLLVQGTSADLDKLNALTVGPKYDNTAIASVAANMERGVKQLDMVRRDIYKAIQKEGKKRKAKSKTAYLTKASTGA